MKIFGALCVILFTLVKSLQAQEEAFFATDEAGKYVLAEVVDSVRIPKEEMTGNATLFMQEHMQGVQASAGDGVPQVTATGSFPVYKKASLGKHQDGVINYRLIVEVKDNRYRYVIRDFVFVPYERNRYGQFEAQKGKDVPLETEVSKLNRKQWEAHRRSAFEFAVSLGEDLKVCMLKKCGTSSPKKSKERISLGESW